MLATLVGLYLVIVFATLAVAARAAAHPTPRPPWAVAAWVVLVLECVYMLQAPACVYLPRVPGQATRRFLLGADDAHRLYWVEGTSPVAFLWGPRWWFAVGHVLGGGMENVPPIRPAMHDRTQWELVSQGRRWPHPGGPWLHELASGDGAVLTWAREMLELKPGESAWRSLARLPNDHPLDLQAVGRAGADSFVELYQDTEVRDKSRGTKRDLILLLRERSGREASRTSLSLPESTSDRSIDAGLFVTVTPTATLVFETWREHGEGQGVTYSVRPGGLVTVLNHFAVRVEDGFPIGVEASPDGVYFTTGQAVFDLSGQKVQDLDPPLDTCRWEGHTLRGVRRYPFFMSGVLARDSRIQFTLARTVRPFKEGRERGRWVFGGLDEAGREDEIVKIELP
jgi:hypothetical protein